MILDTHHHLWKYNSSDYVWMDQRMKLLQKDYLPVNLIQTIRNTPVTHTIVVQARQMIEETIWLLEQAENNPLIAGVVGWVDLCSKRIGDQLERFSVHPKFVGVRHVVHDEPDDLFMLRDDFMHGISLLSDFNLTYDLLVFPKHLPVALKLINKFPNLRFVIDHIAKPDISNQRTDNWLDPMKLLSGFPNVFCKLSGMVTESDWIHWTSSQFDPYLDTLFNLFGPDRLMLGSDWPVCLLAGNYQRVMSIVPSYMQHAGITEIEQQKVMWVTGEKFYGIDTGD